MFANQPPLSAFSSGGTSIFNLRDLRLGRLGLVSAVVACVCAAAAAACAGLRLLRRRLLRGFLLVEALGQCIDLRFERLDLGVARIGSDAGRRVFLARLMLTRLGVGRRWTGDGNSCERGSGGEPMINLHYSSPFLFFAPPLERCRKASPETQVRR